MSYLILTDANSNAYNFPDNFWLQDGGVNTNQNIVNSFYAAGGRNIADGFLQASNITISGILHGDTIAAYETKKRALMQALLKGGQLSRSADSVSRYIDVKHADIQWSSFGGDGDVQLQEVTIIFRTEFPFWVDAAETTSTNIVAGDDSFTVTTTGTDFIINPTIEIDADQSADVPGVKITNKSDGGASFNYDDPFFVQGDIVTINTGTGDITRNGSQTSEWFSGVFIRLQPGANTIEYEGAACTIRVKYRKVYL